MDVLATMRGSETGVMFGAKGEVDPIAHLIGTAVGWGGNPKSAAVYMGVYPRENDGKTVHRLTVKDVPVDGFWSISLYNDKGYFEKNELAAYSLNSLTAKPNPDGAIAHPVRRLSEDHAELSADHAGLELYGENVPATAGDRRRLLEIPGSATGEVKLERLDAQPAWIRAREYR